MEYRATVSQRQGDVQATALAGMHAILLGFDFLGSAARRRSLVGFAVHRVDVATGEGGWLAGQLRFRGQAGSLEDIPTNRAPLQKFHWSDYGAEPGRAYRYSVHAMFRRRGRLDPSDPAVLEVRTASNQGQRLGVHFNRGVTAARAYRRRFGDVPPGEVPGGAALRWLSRGLEEALVGFVDAAGPGDELKVAIYEFEHAGVVAALRAARDRGVELRIVYHARRDSPDDDQPEENRARVDALGLPARRVTARTEVPRLSHNKFVVHLRAGEPARVWTGTANFTDAALYLQTNAGLVLRDRELARAYDAYFDLLAADPAGGEARAQAAALVAAVRPRLGTGQSLFFSPVRGSELLDTARELVDGAREAVFISCPFGLDRALVDALNANRPAVLEYGLVNTTQRRRLIDMIDRSPTAWYATAAWLREYDGRLWDAKAYGQHKIHVKSLVTDPWSARPAVLIGSANFSDESVGDNDENCLLLRGDRRVAAIVATEFLRMFDHYKFRDFVRRTDRETGERFLKEDGSWARPYYDPRDRSGRNRERVVFAQRG